MVATLGQNRDTFMSSIPPHVFRESEALIRSNSERLGSEAGTAAFPREEDLARRMQVNTPLAETR